jgi:hypothetical protein
MRQFHTCLNCELAILVVVEVIGGIHEDSKARSLGWFRQGHVALFLSQCVLPSLSVLALVALLAVEVSRLRAFFGWPLCFVRGA